METRARRAFQGGYLFFPGVLEGDGAVEFSGVLQVCDKITVTLELEALESLERDLAELQAILHDRPTPRSR